MKRPFAVIGLTLFFVTSFLFDFETGVTVTAFIVFAVALVISLLIKNTRTHGFLPLFFASASVACALLIGAVNFLYLPVISYGGKNDCHIKAEITDFEELKYGNSYYESRVVSLNGEPADFKIRLVFSNMPEIEPYDVVEGRFNLYVLGESDEDIMKSYKSQGVFLGGYPVRDEYTVTQIPEADKPLAKKILDLRAGIKNSVYRVMPDEYGDLAVALIIGDTTGLPDDIYSDFREIGISHIICVSGFHLSLWSMFILNILKKTGMKRWLANVISGVCVVMLMLVAGLTYSVIRAGIMMLVFLFGDIIMRRRDSLNSLGFALSFLALINPLSMGSVSLKLSALATLGIILYNEYLSPKINEYISKIEHTALRKAARNIVSALMITVSATAFTLPVSLVLYGSFNYICFVANLLIVAVAGWSMVVCSAGALFGALFPGIFNIFSFIGNLMLRFIVGVSDHLADYDFLTFRINEEKTVILLGGLFVFCLAAVFVSTFKKPVYGTASILCVLIFTVSIVTFSHFENRETKITVFDCGNGTSVLISCNGENMLVGCGGTEFFGSNRIKNTVSLSGNGIDTIVVPDSDEKSSAYLQDIIEEYRPERIFYDSLPEGTDLLLEGCEKDGFSELSGNGAVFAESIVIDGCRCVMIESDDVSALICFDPTFDYNKLPDEFRRTDVVVSRSRFPENTSFNPETSYILSADEIRARSVCNALSNSGIDCISNGNCNVLIRAKDKEISVNTYKE